jgi:hypothetical protein
MSGGGGSGSDGSNDTDVSGAEAVATGGSTYSDRKIDNSVGYTSQDNVREQQRGDNQYHRARTQAAQVDAEDVYDAPDRDHFNQTQREIAQKSKDVVDTTMSKEQYDEFNKNMNQYYGTDNVKYEPYGRAGKGTVNLTFKEHFKNVQTQNPLMKFSPVLSFLTAAGRNVSEYLTSDYGTYKYAGPGTDSGGLLGGGGDNRTQAQRDSEIMRNLAPEAPYIVSGITRPTNSPAANWYQSLGNTSTSGFNFSYANELAAAKAKQASILGNPSPVGQLAVSQSPFYNWLKERSLDKGIL